MPSDLFNQAAGSSSVAAAKDGSTPATDVLSERKISCRLAGPRLYISMVAVAENQPRDVQLIKTA